MKNAQLKIHEEVPMTTKLAQVIEDIDAVNQQDPNKIIVAGSPSSKELLYSRRMSERLSEFEPKASEHLSIAAHGQHIARWKIPRSSYEKTRAGYLKWRKDLGVYHGEQLALIMAARDYSNADIERVKKIVGKKGIKSDPEIQTLEDVICLVFIEHYLEAFALEHEKEKIIDIIRKTWTKMSDRGQQAALKISLPDQLNLLVGQALN